MFGFEGAARTGAQENKQGAGRREKESDTIEFEGGVDGEHERIFI